MRSGLVVVVVASVGLAGCNMHAKDAQLGEVPLPGTSDGSMGIEEIAWLPTDAPEAFESRTRGDVLTPVQPQLVDLPPRSHTVVKRDTLWSIAARYYGDGKRWPDIAEANRIADPRKLRVGTQLHLP